MINIFSFILLFATLSHASGAPDWDKTYSTYRERLHRDFVSVGYGKGQCLPAAFRTPTKISFSDTTVHMGWYLGTLATELGLSKKNPAFYEKGTLRLISCALNALDRLGLKDGGYFIRDDVDESLLRFFPTGLEVESDFLVSNVRMKEMSQDQFIHLLLGYSLLDEYLDESDSWHGVRLKEKVRAQVSQVLSHIYGRKGTRWLIRRPDGEKVLRGHDSRGFSSALLSATEKILGTEATRSYRPYILSGLLFSRLKPAWLPLRFYYRTLSLILGSIGNAWGSGTARVVSNHARMYQLELFPYLHSVLHGSQVPSSIQADVEKGLNQAPIEGPYLGDEHGWNSTIRFHMPVRNRKNPPKYKRKDYHPEPGTQFNGLDFMLMRNLVELYRLGH